MLTRRSVLQSLAAATATPVFGAQSINDRMAGDYVPMHDPCIIKHADTYYVFGTGQPDAKSGHIPCRTSKDLITWRDRGFIFPKIPEWAVAAVPGTREMWAPDISYFNNQYYLYWAVSTFGSNRSAIGLTTNVTLDPADPRYEWKDRGMVLMSQKEDNFNAIDPAHVIDREGKHWLSFGSFWTGLKMVRMDPNTGKRLESDKAVHSIAARPAPTRAPGAIEAPFIIERNGYYYLFASYDYCCKGAHSSYYTAMGRSKEILGPYLGQDGGSMLEGRGTVVLRGDSRNSRYRGPGHVAILRDPGQDYIVYHAYDAEKNGARTLRIAPITWTEDGWPTVES